MSAPLSHYLEWDNPNWNSRIVRAVCGRNINPRTEFSASPTCPQCQIWLHRDDGLTEEDVFGPPEPTTKGAA